MIINLPEIKTKQVTIGEVFKVSSGGTPSRKKDEYFTDGNIAWVKTGDLKGKFVNSATEFISQLGLDNSSAKLFPPKTVLLAMYGATIGACSILPFEAATNQACAALLPSDDCDENFLYYYLAFIKPSLINKGVGGAQPNISAGLIKNLKIPLPSLPEQQKITAILDAADSLRQKDQQLIEKYNALSQSLFLDMFGDPITNPMGFKKSNVGEQCMVKGGKRVPKGENLVKENTGYPYIKAGNIKNGKVTTKNLEYLTPGTREKLKRYIVNEGDVCITVVGVNIGDIGIVPKKLHLANLTENANKLLIKNHNTLSNFYLCFSLQMESIQQQIKKKTMAVGVPKLALFRIQELELLLPPLILQNQFAERIQSIETQKQQAQASLQKSEALFNSLLQRAFKGELTA